MPLLLLPPFLQTILGGKCGSFAIKFDTGICIFFLNFSSSHTRPKSHSKGFQSEIVEREWEENKYILRGYVEKILVDLKRLRLWCSEKHLPGSVPQSYSSEEVVRVELAPYSRKTKGMEIYLAS